MQADISIKTDTLTNVGGPPVLIVKVVGVLPYVANKEREAHPVGHRVGRVVRVHNLEWQRAAGMRNKWQRHCVTRVAIMGETLPAASSLSPGLITECYLARARLRQGRGVRIFDVEQTNKNLSGFMLLARLELVIRSRPELTNQA